MIMIKMMEKIANPQNKVINMKLSLKMIMILSMILIKQIVLIKMMEKIAKIAI